MKVVFSILVWLVTSAVFAANTIGVQVVAVLPPTCSVGELYYLTPATAGQNVYGCTSANTFTLQGAAGGVTSATGTANQIAVSAATGAVTFSIPTNPTLPGTTTGTFSGNLTGNVSGSSGSTTGNAATATALAANPTDCSSNQFANAIAANGNLTCAALAAADLPSNQKIRSFSGSFDGGGIALTTGKTVYTTIPYACTISAYNILADTGTATIKFWRLATGTAIPTVANTISTSGVALSSGTAIHSTTVSDFTSTAIAANDIVAINLFAVASATFINVVIQCDAT